MKIVLYKCSDDERVLNKTLSDALELDGTIKDGGDIVNPFVIVKGSPADLMGYNFAHVEAFGRFYFVKSFVVLTNSLVSISLSIDVLMSFRNELLLNVGRVAKSANPERWKLSKEVLDTNSTKQLFFDNPFNFEGVNVLVAVNGNQTAETEV